MEVAFFLDCYTPKIKELKSLKTSKQFCWTKQLHILQD